jgi:phage gp36-like protein
MSYLTEDGYTARFGSEELEQVLASAPDATLAQAIADAQSIVDGYLAAVPDRVFTVPLVTTPARIAEITADLTRYELHAKKATFEQRRRRDQAIAFLEGMVAGKLAIPELLPEGGAVPIALDAGMDVTAEARVFTTDTLRGYLG